MRIRWLKKKLILSILTWTVLLLFIGARLITILGYEPYQILSGSMEPTLEIGEIVLIDTNHTQVENGDVIAFYMGEQVVIHRIQETISDGVYITKGDANPNVDFSTVEKEDIIGTLWVSLRWISLIWSVITSNMKWWIVFALVSLNIASEVYEKEKEDSEYE